MTRRDVHRLLLGAAAAAGCMPVQAQAATLTLQDVTPPVLPPTVLTDRLVTASDAVNSMRS